MIYWLASYPRSGNTFFRLLLHHRFGLNTYAVQDSPQLNRLGAAETVGHKPLPGKIEELAASERPYIVKTHHLPSDDRPAIYLVRDGRDVLVSYARYRMTFASTKHERRPFGRFGERREFKRMLRELILDDRYGGWSENVRQWHERAAGGNTFVLRFEDLVDQPDEWSTKAVTHVGLDVAPTQDVGTPTFEELHARWPEFFRKGKVGAWRDEMPDELHDLFWDRHGEAMRVLGYER